jgi:hypothetical protein
MAGVTTRRRPTLSRPRSTRSHARLTRSLNDQAAVSLPLAAPDACPRAGRRRLPRPDTFGRYSGTRSIISVCGTRRTRVPPPYRLGSVAIIFVAPVAAAEMGTRFATGFREEEEQQNDHNGHEHGDQPLLSLCAFIRLSFPHPGFSTCSWPLRTDFCGTARRAMVLTTRTVFGCPRRRSWEPGRLALDRLARAGSGSACRGRAAGVLVPEVVSLESLAEGVAVLSAGNVLRGGRRRDERERN